MWKQTYSNNQFIELTNGTDSLIILLDSLLVKCTGSLSLSPPTGNASYLTIQRSDGLSPMTGRINCKTPNFTTKPRDV